jgi:hypothetical protein
MSRRFGSIGPGPLGRFRGTFWACLRCSPPSSRASAGLTSFGSSSGAATCPGRQNADGEIWRGGEDRHAPGGLMPRFGPALVESTGSRLDGSSRRGDPATSPGTLLGEHAVVVAGVPSGPIELSGPVWRLAGGCSVDAVWQKALGGSLSRSSSTTATGSSSGRPTIPGSTWPPRRLNYPLRRQDRRRQPTTSRPVTRSS